jgi:hypothetical protein
LSTHTTVAFTYNKSSGTQVAILAVTRSTLTWADGGAHAPLELQRVAETSEPAEFQPVEAAGAADGVKPAGYACVGMQQARHEVSSTHRARVHTAYGR